VELADFGVIPDCRQQRISPMIAARFRGGIQGMTGVLLHHARALPTLWQTQFNRRSEQCALRAFHRHNTLESRVDVVSWTLEAPQWVTGD
jgi:hypothetical protein